jgi:hypothetical protein
VNADKAVRKRKSTTMSQLSDQFNDRQILTLKQYKDQFIPIGAEKGRPWRESLIDDWMGAGERTRFKGDWAYLQQIRNSIDWAWLENLSDEEIDSAAAERLEASKPQP